MMKLFYRKLALTGSVCIAFAWPGFGSRGATGMALQEASSMPDRARAIWVQDIPSAGQGQPHG